MILLTAWTHLETAVELVREGAADYIAKPWDDARLLTTVRNLLDLRRARREAEALRGHRREARAALAARFDLRGIVYESEAMHTLVAMATQVAHADVPVLITGPNGAGKEVLADIVQANSERADRPYFKVNLGALPNELIEAELFGTEAGAFTGARARAGRFEAADGGTLFLDELGDARRQRPGEAAARAADRRVRAARLQHHAPRPRARHRRHQHQPAPGDPRRHLPRGPVLPPERHRARGAAARRAPRGHPAARPALPRARLRAQRRRPTDALVRYPWPGNVRELQNTIRRACLLSGSRVIEAATLNLSAAASAGRAEPELDRPAVEQALARAGGVVAHAARDLGLSRQALYRRMEKLGLKADAPRPPPGA